MSNTTETKRTYTRKPVSLLALLGNDKEKEFDATLADFVKADAIKPAAPTDRPEMEEIALALDIVRRTVANWPTAIADVLLKEIAEEVGADTEEA